MKSHPLKKRKFHLSGLTPVFMISLGVASILFHLLPDFDIWVSNLFYSPKSGFYLKEAIPVLWIYQSVEILAVILVAGLPAMLLVVLVRKKPLFSITAKQIAYLICILALGPGLMVNVVFKNQWGRARPDQIEVFGGSKRFTPPFVKSGECDRNCAFVSGHASIGFYGVAPALLMGSGQLYGIAAAFCFGMIIGIARIIQGGHFLSDVIFSFFVVYVIARVVHHWMFKRLGGKDKRI